MLNYLWGYMILIGIGFGILTGEVEALSNAAIDSTGEAVTMAITMLGIMSMWTGLIEIAKRSGLLDQITRKLDPVLHFLFPRIPKDHIAKEYISANIVANLLGLGWAATPMGLKAMKELAKIERERLSDTSRPIRKDSGQHDCLPFPIRFRQSCSRCVPRSDRHHYQYDRRYYFLQDHVP